MPNNRWRQVRREKIKFEDWLMSSLWHRDESHAKELIGKIMVSSLEKLLFAERGRN